MARRGLTWAIVPPLLAAGVLVAHALAYALVPTRLGNTHDYLAHAPQVLAIAGVLGLLALGGATRSARPGPLPFVALATLTFCLQEHLERLAHGGHVGFLVASPVFLVGLALQIPVALVVWLVALWLMQAPGQPRPRRPRLGWSLTLDRAAPPALARVRSRSGAVPGRGPPHHL